MFFVDLARVVFVFTEKKNGKAASEITNAFLGDSSRDDRERLHDDMIRASTQSWKSMTLKICISLLSRIIICWCVCF